MVFVMFSKWSIVNILLLSWCCANPNFRTKGLNFVHSYQEPSKYEYTARRLEGCGQFCNSCDSSWCNSCILPDQMMQDPNDYSNCICSSGTYCSYENVCITCNSYYYPYCSSTDSGCLACGEKCKTCSSSNSCSECAQPDLMHIVSSLGSCACNEGYTSYPYDNNQCVSCPNLCSACSSLTQCTACKQNAELGSNWLCQCKFGYYLNNSNKCIATCNSLCTSCSENDGNFCYGCVPNAELKGNSCSCTDNSYFDAQNLACSCRNGYYLSHSKCITCKKYLSNALISGAFFSPSMSFLYVAFYVNVDITVDAACDKVLLDSSLEKMGKNPICTWVDSRTLRISLGLDFTQRIDEILLNGLYIIKSGEDKCTLDYEPLAVKPKLEESIYPQAILSGPSYFSLCGIDPLIFSVDLSTGFIGSSFSYQWSAVLSPSNSLVSSKIAENKDSTIYISQLWFNSNIPVTSLNTTITLTNILGLSSNFTMVTKVVKEDTLSVQFDQGSNMTIKASDQVTLKPRIVHMCGDSTESIDWIWTFQKLNSSNHSPAQFFGSNSDKFTIYPGLLEVGMSYIFTAIASQLSNGINVLGNASISIQVTDSPLYLQLSRSSGDTSPNRDLILSASESFDPDSPSSTIFYDFSCKNHANGSECLDSNGEKLFATNNFSSTIIPSSRLIKGAQWDIKAKIYRGERSESKDISIHVHDQDSSITVEIPTDNIMINSQQLNIFSAAVSARQGSEMWWSQISGRGVKLSPNYLSTISFPAYTFNEGETYIFQLYIMENSVVFRSQLNITTNLGAVCRKSTSIVPDSGRALYDFFTISIFGCYDRDESNYPLYYTFQDTWNGLNYTLGHASQSNKITTYLYSGTNVLNAHVCDQLLTCSDYPLKVTINPYDAKLWQNSSLAYAYWKSTIDTDNIPSSIALFCSMSVLDWNIFDIMWNDLQKYVRNSNIVNNSILSLVLDATLSLTLQTGLVSLVLYHGIFNLLGGILANNPSLIPTVQDIKKIVLIGENYLLYGRNSKYRDQAFEKYIWTLDQFYNQWIVASTALDLVTQSSLNGSQNTENTLIYNYRNFQSKWLNWTMNLGSSGSIKFPASLSFDNTDIMNFRVIYYNSSKEDSQHFGIISLGFSNSGSYSNYALLTHKADAKPYSTVQYPFTIELPIYKKFNSELNCFFYNEAISNWTSSYCSKSKVSNSSISFAVTHFSMYKISEDPATIPNKDDDDDKDDNKDKEKDDKHNYAPIFILVGTIISPFILIPIFMFFDFIIHKGINCNKKSKDRKENPSEIKDLDIYRIQAGGDSPETAYRSNSIRSPQEEGPNWTEGSFAKHNKIEQEEEENPKSKCKKFETVLEKLIEGHLVLGFLALYRSTLSRLLKLFTIMTIILFELFLEGLFFYIYEDTETLIAKSTQSLFIRYQAHYFLYTVYALLITFPIEILMVMTLCIDYSPKSFGFRFSIVLGTILLSGSIVGIPILNKYIMRSWCGFWAISYLYGALIEIFGIQMVWMMFRYIFVYCMPKIKN
ncbi:unnamed protein product [Blepharisma stoltei]|uniref:TNFR-Cys domain-containing protein n=1 Tax=Blepharisma stoltei TaxID=1481888 RepID=A0AAU9J196_9CILI|nr:unnamed protein product [Blepharisma stoltei]